MNSPTMLRLSIILAVLCPLQVELFPIPSFSDLRALFDFAYDVYSKLNDFHDLYTKFQTSASLNDIMLEINDISRSVNQLGNRLERKLDTVVQTLLKRLSVANDISADLRELHRSITTVDTLFDDFTAYTSVDQGFNNATILSFARSITTHGSNTDLNHIVSQMQSLIVPGRGGALKESVILLLSKQTQISLYDDCDLDRPAHQRFFEIYSILIMTEIRVFLMTSFAYTYRSSFEEGTYMAEVNLRKKQFMLRTELYMMIFHEALRWSPRGVRRCDPAVHKRGETFHEFERFINAYVVTEEALNSEQSCKGTCGSQPNPTSLYDNCVGFECEFTAQSCEGSIIDCRSGENRMQVCLAPPVPRTIWNPRRYEWFRDGTGVLYGNNQAGCLQGRLKTPEWYWKHAAYSCDICICSCVDDAPLSIAHHFVSLREVVADIDNNMVVTGVKFTTTNQVKQIEIQQGKLMQDGVIDKESTSWKRPDNLSKDVRKSRKTFVFQQDGWRQMKTNVDIAVLTYKDRRFNLDRLEAPKGHLMTGIKFSRISGSDDNSNAIQLEIRVTPFDYVSGKLINLDKSYWVTPEHMKDTIKAYGSERTQIDQPNYLMSPLAIQLTVPSFEPNKWIQLEKTGNREDAGQTVIPLLDGVPVEVKPALPLSGVNLFHKSAERYGGLISFQILVIDRSEYMKLTNDTEL